MPFGLGTRCATYQRLVDKTFHGQIGRNLEVYEDDLVIKSRMVDEVIRDIEETFKTLRKINMKLNPKKCTFGVEEGIVFRIMVITKGIKICPVKVDCRIMPSVTKMPGRRAVINGKLASLKRDVTFRQMKEHIAKLPMLIAPEEQEELIVYLAASKEAVSVVLMTERETSRDADYTLSVRALRGLEV
ncbi:hypothetical protein Tco_0482187 [Tanacetum coccineum]